MKQEHITLRCEDGAEAVVFTKYIYSTVCSRAAIVDPDSISYEITIEDSYTSGDYKGFFGRIKRAWKAFWDKPVVYTGIYCEDKDTMRKFLYDCLDLVNDNPDTDITESYKGALDNIIPPQWRDDYKIYCEDNSVTSNEELIKKGEW